MSAVAIIPARGGSKRIPRKNIRPFFDKPVIYYSIKVALDSGLFDEVMVSTGDNEIASIARDCGASVPFERSARNSDDFATTADVLEEVLQSYQDMGRLFETGCCIYPAAPLVSVQRLKEAWLKLAEGDFDSVFPICEYGYPILRSLTMMDDGTVSMNWPEYLKTRSQDIPKSYHDAGQFYWFNTHRFREQKTLFCKRSGAIILSPQEVQDIDTESDWKMAELKYRSLHGA